MFHNVRLVVTLAFAVAVHGRFDEMHRNKGQTKLTAALGRP
jgi:hypothetical protein